MSDKKVILIVEDDEYLCESYKTELEAHNFLVIIARDGVEALESLKPQRPNLIVVDLIMPKMGGMELVKEIIKIEDLKNIPIIIATNVEDEEIKKQALKLGVKELYIKSDLSLDKFSEICERNINW